MKPPNERSGAPDEGDPGSTEDARIAAVNAERLARRGFIVFATDSELPPDHPSYRLAFATEAETRARAVAKVRPLAGERRLRAFLISEKYRHELAEARWID